MLPYPFDIIATITAVSGDGKESCGSDGEGACEMPGVTTLFALLEEDFARGTVDFLLLLVISRIVEAVGSVGTARKVAKCRKMALGQISTRIA